MEKELNNCGNTRKALYLRLYSVCLNYTIRAYFGYNAAYAGSSSQGCVQTPRTYACLNHKRHLRSFLALGGGYCCGQAGGHADTKLTAQKGG